MGTEEGRLTNKHAPFLPVSRKEMQALGWKQCDIIIVSGDAYVDHPSFGATMIGRHLESLGYRVGIIPQPDCSSTDDFLELGIPKLFVGITAGAMDSMVNHYTSLDRIRSDDAYSEDGLPGKRPDRALMKYSNRIQQAMKGTPIVLGGIEASLRRVAHYDFWQEKIRRSILLDTKADILVYGMGERAIGEIAGRLSAGEDLNGIRGTAVYMSNKVYEEFPIEGAMELPSYEDIQSDGTALLDLTAIIERENSPYCGAPLIQRSDTRVTVIYPPSEPLSTEEMDVLYDLPFARKPHPKYIDEIPAYEMIRHSITAVRGCSGGCSFCALGLHQGRFISSRSKASILRELRQVTYLKSFEGSVSDVGGPTANLYGLGCGSESARNKCRRNSCLYPEICTHFKTDHGPYLKVLDAVWHDESVRFVFIASGIRFDVALRDRRFIRELCKRYVSGLLKIAPEHFAPKVLQLMRKPDIEVWREFVEVFDKYSKERRKTQHIIPYIMAAFPGCTVNDMKTVWTELTREGISSEKTQIFLPTPMTMATAMYYTHRHPDTREKIHVATRPSQKKRQL